MAITCAVLLYASLKPLFGFGFGSGFDEGTVATLYSVILLGTIGWVCFRIGKARAAAGAPGQTRPFWRFVGAAFVFLALDEGIQIHEGLDDLLHILLIGEETAWSDRIDDVIVLAYGLAGAALLVRHRQELRISGIDLRLIAIAFGVFLVSGLVDIATNRSEYIALIGLGDLDEVMLENIEEAIEESTKLIAGALLLLGFAQGVAVTTAPQGSDVRGQAA